MASSSYTPSELKANISGRLVGVTAAFLSLSVISVALRMYVRVFLSKSFGADDIMTLVTLVFYILNSSFALAGTHYGTGQHIPALSPSNYSQAMKMWFFAELFYPIASTFVRISVGMLLLRLTTIRWQRITVYCVMTLSTIAGIILAFGCLFQCRPIGYYWSYDKVSGVTGGGTCLDPKVTSDLAYMHGAAACIGDWTLGIMPWFLVKKLNMNTRSKVSVGLLLCLANFGSVATVVRFYSINQLGSTDFLYQSIGLAVWSCIEVGTAIPAASIVTLRPLFRNFFGSSKGATSGGLPIPGRSGFRGGSVYKGGPGYIRHITPNSKDDMNIELNNKGPMKSSVTTTVVGNSSHQTWKKNPYAGSSDNLSSDEEPLQIIREYDVKVNYSRNTLPDQP